MKNRFSEKKSANTKSTTYDKNTCLFCGKKYAKDGSVRPQSPDALYSEKARSARVFKEVRDKAAKDEKYVIMRKEWRSNE